MTVALLLAVLQAPALNADEAEAKALKVAAKLGMNPGHAARVALVSDPSGERPPEYLVDLSPNSGPPNTTVLRVRASDGALLAVFDSAGRARPIPNWSPRIAKVQARAKVLQYARNTFAMPPDWAVTGGTFGGPGRDAWPKAAALAFQERPFGYRYFLGGNSARITVDPRTGKLRSWSFSDGAETDHATVRLRPDQAAAVARKYRADNRGEPRPAERGPVQLGWAPPLDASGRPERNAPQRLVYRVRFFNEDHFVDANNGRLIGNKRTR